MTYTDALNYVISTISHGPSTGSGCNADSGALLIVTLRRLAVICAGREDGPELLEGFCNAYYGELSNVRWRKQLEAVIPPGDPLRPEFIEGQGL